MKSHTALQRRGVVLIAALCLIGLATALIADAVTQAGVEVRQTRQVIVDSQLSQLIIAGASAARNAASAVQRVDGPVETPVGKITLSWQADHSCTIDAECANSHRSINIKP
jgi:type II secretory pathway component PulK